MLTERLKVPSEPKKRDFSHQKSRRCAPGGGAHQMIHFKEHSYHGSHRAISRYIRYRNLKKSIPCNEQAWLPPGWSNSDQLISLQFRFIFVHSICIDEISIIIIFIPSILVPLSPMLLPSLHWMAWVEGPSSFLEFVGRRVWRGARGEERRGEGRGLFLG